MRTTHAIGVGGRRCWLHLPAQHRALSCPPRLSSSAAILGYMFVYIGSGSTLRSRELRRGPCYNSPTCSPTSRCIAVLSTPPCKPPNLYPNGHPISVPMPLTPCARVPALTLAAFLRMLLALLAAGWCLHYLHYLHHPLPASYHLLPTTHCLLPTAY